jgi:hypothetical protein
MRVATNRYVDVVTVRCTTAGSCDRIGPVAGGPSVVPVTRNVS